MSQRSVRSVRSFRRKSKFSVCTPQMSQAESTRSRWYLHRIEVNQIVVFAMNRPHLRQHRSSHLIVPNILHYVWLNTGDLQYWTAINTMASIYVIKPDVVWIHCKVSPSGPNWSTLTYFTSFYDVPIELHFVPSKIQIFNITPHHLAHQSDVTRMNALRHYGGIYLDLDVVVLKPLDELRLYNMSVAAWGETISNSVIIAAPNSDFMNVWYDSYRHANFRCWGCNSLTIPAKLMKAHPGSVHALSIDSFYRYGLHEADAKAMFDELCDVSFTVHPRAFGQHLWANNMNIKTYLSHVDYHFLCHSCSLYAVTVLKILRC